MSMKVQTVLGPIDAKDMGRTLAHEHFTWGYPGCQGQTRYPYDRKEGIKICLEYVEKIKRMGDIKTVVDFTCNDMGRDIELLREVSERGEINIIFPTGFLYDKDGGSAYWRFKQFVDPEDAEKELYELYMEEITMGVGKSGIKPGYLKSAGGLNGLSPYEEMIFRVTARVAKETGIRVCSHTEAGTYAPEIAKFYLDAGLAPNQVNINHLCGNPSIQYQRDTLDQGVFGSFDRFGLQGWMGATNDENRMITLIGLINSGYLDQLMISCDTNMYWGGKAPNWTGPMANYVITHMFDYVLPTLRERGITDAQIDRMMIDNPRRFFGNEP